MKIVSAFCQSLFEEAFTSFDHIPFTFWGDNRPTDEQLDASKINVYYRSEPNAYFGNEDWIRQNWKKFDLVLTLDPTDIPNGVFCPFGTSAFHDRVPNFDKALQHKHERVSFIRGNKHFDVQGHHLRWELWNRQDEINLPMDFHGQTSPPYASNPAEEVQWFSQRSSVFGDSMFHIAIENTSTVNYFTEKIIDCFLFRTVPIYFGHLSINNFFNPRGIITFNTVDELIGICNSLTREDFLERQSAIYDNHARCMQYLHLGKTVARKLEAFFKFNGLLW